MKKKTIGIIPAPDLPTSQAESMREYLCKSLKQEIDDQVEWHTEIIVSPLTGSAEKVKDIMDEASSLREENSWEYAICITDLPVFSGKNAVLAEVNISARVAQISLAAFGALPTAGRVRKTVIHVIKELHSRQMGHDIKLIRNGIGPAEMQGNKQDHFFKRVSNKIYFSRIHRRKADEDADGSSVRFVISPKIIGLVRVLLGMAIANRPWKIMPSFKSVVALAFATGAYGLIFPTLWQLSISYELPRFYLLMFAAISGMIAWLIFAHDLWEKPNKNKVNNLRWLYNTATIITLATSILMYYLVLFILFLIAVTLFVPPDLYQAQTDQNIELGHYIRLAWLVTSVATAAGAIGSGLEKTDAVRKITYGYRQYIRYEEIKQQEKNDEQKKYGKSDAE